jgi:hypothetical protein
MRSSRLLAGLAEFALHVLLRDLHIPQSHANIFVAEQLHQGRKTDAESEHLGGKGVSKAMRGHVAGATGTLSGLD